jgi:hypothetical protein
MSKLRIVEIKGSDCLCEVLESAKRRQGRSVKTPLDVVQRGVWTGDACQDANGNWGTIQPNGTCKVTVKNNLFSF